jgi:hypothetical protein
MKPLALGVVLIGVSMGPTYAQSIPPTSAKDATPGDAMLTRYFAAETARLQERCLAEIRSAADWESKRDDYRRELQEMLGLWPMPERTDLKPIVTGRIASEGFGVEKVQFQASPGLYCTANLYLPTGLTEPAPTILYECGHWRLVTNGISYGNKAMYQTEGAWFARNGYVCLVLDTLLAGEIQGIHAGTRDHGLWWWNSRGYTPAGIEAWFGIRALDYLSTRREVDTNRFGITGHSGGGAYSWTVTALDDRIKASAPLAGMTDLHHHIVGNLMDSHCDCNFPINIHGWDFPQLAAMAAPRPLLIGGTDNDRIFPLAGTLAIHDKVGRVYGVLGASDKLGLVIAPGGHEPVQELRLAVLRWFNRHLKGLTKEAELPLVVDSRRFFTPEQLKVFEALPQDAINTNIAEGFVPLAAPQHRTAEQLRPILRDKVFSGWPDEDTPLNPLAAWSVERDDLRFSAWDFASQTAVDLRLYLLERASGSPAACVELTVLDAADWTNWLATMATRFGDTLVRERADAVPANAAAFESLRRTMADTKAALAFFAPRGVGLTAWSGDAKRQTRIRRRFMLLGQTVDGMRVWDIRRAVQTVHFVRDTDAQDVRLTVVGPMAVNALYAALFEPGARQLSLSALPDSHTDGPDYLAVLTVTDLPEVKAAVSARARLDVGP